MTLNLVHGEWFAKECEFGGFVHIDAATIGAFLDELRQAGGNVLAETPFCQLLFPLLCTIVLFRQLGSRVSWILHSARLLTWQ